MEDEDRLSTEIELLQSMYPDQLTFNAHAREMTYLGEGSSLKLRLPDGYLYDALPEVLVAITKNKVDLSDQMRRHIIDNCIAGEEILDSIVSEFTGLVDTTSPDSTSLESSKAKESSPSTTKASVIVWLHHLLNTNKRKQALSPASPSVAGVTKPGYPGVLVYSGPSDAVHQHVDDLKRLNWQAFQIRMDSDEEWAFTHGAGVVEVESMKDVVAEVGERRKVEFMEAMRMK